MSIGITLALLAAVGYGTSGYYGLDQRSRTTSGRSHPC
jgi:uncharacterized protein HemX